MNLEKLKGFTWVALSIAATATKCERLPPQDRTADKFYELLEEFVQRALTHPELDEAQKEELSFLTSFLIAARCHPQVKFLLSELSPGPIQ